ncbi:hypothetical protein D3X69_20575, partial [Acinetobacter baumannii]|uniref:twin-arginine translocase subunit TatC n=1 Tax=Acinetobacter baumannii TaxID=470 RepID=UPI000FED10ED
FKLNFFVALMLALPFLLSALWSFVRPALSHPARPFALPVLLGRLLFFSAGVAFASSLPLPALFPVSSPPLPLPPPPSVSPSGRRPPPPPPPPPSSLPPSLLFPPRARAFLPAPALPRARPFSVRCP